MTTTTEDSDSDDDKPLGRRHGHSDSEDSDPDLTNTDLGVVDRIVDTHLWTKKNRRFYLVEWKGYDPQTNLAWERSWEPASGLRSCASAISAFKKAHPKWHEMKSEECERMLEEEVEFEHEK